MAKCAECGLLGIRHDDYLTLIEADERSRQDGIAAYKRSAPLCSVRQLQFPTVPDECRSQLNCDRDCPMFIRWKLGFSPKEHSEMITAQILLESQKSHEEAERRWREEQAERDRIRRQEDIAVLKKDMKIKIAMPILAAVTGATLAAILAWCLRGERIIVIQMSPSPQSSQQAIQQ